MSGSKEARIKLREWWQRRVSAPLARAILEPGVLADLRERSLRQVESDLRAMRDRQASTERAVHRLGEQTRQLEVDTARRLQAHATVVEDSVRNLGDQLRGELLTALAEQERTWRAEIKAERDRVAEQIHQLKKPRERAAEFAAQWLGDARTMRDLIDETLPHERYRPGELASLVRRLDTAEDNIEQDLPEAALTMAQQTFHELGELRADLEMRHREWVLRRAAALEAMLVVEERIKANARTSVFDQDGRDLDAVDVDHWSGGELSKLGDEVATVLSEIRDDGRPLSVHDLRILVDQRAPALDKQVDDVVELARMRVTASQLRANVADLVTDALEGGFAYRTEYWSYLAADQRETIFARLRGPDDNEIVIEVAPAGEQLLDSNLRIHSYDTDTRSVEQREARMAAITEYLRARQIPVGDSQDRGDADPALRRPDLLAPSPKAAETAWPAGDAQDRSDAASGRPG